MGDTRTDSGQFYPGGKVIPRQPVTPGGGDMNHSEFADLEGKENMTQKESNRLLNTIVRKLKGVSALAVSAFVLTYLVLASSAALGPETDFGDISPTNKLKEVVEASGAISGVDTNTVAALANIAIATNALTVTATNDIATLQTSKRDKTNLEVETYVPATDWEITYNPSGWSGDWAVQWVVDPQGSENVGWVLVDLDGYVSGILSTDPYETSITDTVYWAWSPGFGVSRTIAHVEYDRLGLVSQLPETNQLLTEEQRTAIADMAKKADEFTEWVSVPPLPYGYSIKLRDSWSDGLDARSWRIADENDDPVSRPRYELDGICFRWDEASTDIGYVGVSTRRRVLRTGDAATPQELAAKQDALPYPTNAVPWGVIEDPPNIPVISETDPTFSNAVLAVGMDFSTNEVTSAAYVAATNVLAQLGFDADALAELPGGKVYGSVGALLAALAAAVAWMKKKKVDKLKVTDTATGTSIEVTAENGIAKLDDFFAKSDGSARELKNALLQSAIDRRLPIPISVKSAGFTTESYKRFVVNVSGTMTLTLHTPTSGDAEIFECRFNGSSLAADASVQFDASGATATTMDTDCGTVKAGKVALMSAFWNGATWDVNWKVEG